MTSLIRNPLTIVWALLTTVTIASSWIALEGGASHRINTTVTTAVLLIAAVKAHLVIRHFMEVRHAFTLVELLVVLGMLALDRCLSLGSLAPSHRVARSNASTACVSSRPPGGNTARITETSY